MKVLVIVHSPTWFTELSVLGRFIHALPEHSVVFHIVNYRHWTIPRFAAALRQDGIACEVEKGAELATLEFATPQPDERARGRARAAVVAVARKLGVEEVRDFFRDRHSLAQATADAGELVRAHAPDVVVLGGDNPGYSTPALIKGFHDKGVPVVIVPSTMSNGLEEAEIYTGNPRHHVRGLLKRLVGALFPKWVVEHKGLRLLRCSTARILALEALRLAPPKPWTFNSGFADAIAMESEAMLDYYAAAGLSRDRMVLTGSPSDDLLAARMGDAARRREALYEELGLPPNRPMLLTALVPDFLYVIGGRPQCDFRDYGSLVDFWVGAVADQNSFNVVVALHPSMKYEEMQSIERANTRIARGKTAELIPLCDLYVASISSTIRWAIACGKPVVNYDIYRYRYTDFLGVAGIAATEEQPEFKALIKRFADDPAYLDRMTDLQRSEAARWGRLDGQSSRRIVGLLAATAAGTAPSQFASGQIAA